MVGNWLTLASMQSSSSSGSATEILNRLLGEWRTLTLAETTAIHSSDWEGLEKLHGRKLALQRLIEDSETKFLNDQSVSVEKRSSEKQRLRQLAAELLTLEEKNRVILAEQMSHADKQLKLSNKAIRSLRHVQQAYGAADRSFWQAYS